MRMQVEMMCCEFGEPQTLKGLACKLSMPLGLWLDVAYGFDHACGYFVQAKPIGADEWTIDFDSLFDGLTGNELIDIFAVLRLPVEEAVIVALLEDRAF